jgi:hypothetical protein
VLHGSSNGSRGHGRAQGDSLSRHYPHVREAQSRALLRAGRPFPVYSCWNGAVAVDARAFVEASARARCGARCWDFADAALPLQRGITFRSWRVDELVSPSADADPLQVRCAAPPPPPPPLPAHHHHHRRRRHHYNHHRLRRRRRRHHRNQHRHTCQVFDDFSCTVSECQLVCKDLWAAGLGRIVINPRVHVYYTWRSYYMQRYVMSWVNRLFMSWAHMLVMRTSEAQEDVWSIRDPPAHIACGIDTDDGRSIPRGTLTGPRPPWNATEDGGGFGFGWGRRVRGWSGPHLEALRWNLSRSSSSSSGSGAPPPPRVSSGKVDPV